MVQSKAATVDDYIAEAPPDRREALSRVREIARRALAGREERMQWGMPCYFRDGEAEFSFASQVQYIALYVKPGVHAKNADALKGLDCGKGCIRFRKPGDIDFTLVERLLRDTAESDEAPC
jgi:uncharacterized protein YdhG (YjbR/CyaY superfamily)